MSSQTAIERHIDALSSGLIATDASRRVGWARAYSAAEKVDNLSRDLNVARSDVEIYRRACSHLYGFLTAYVHFATTGEGSRRLADLVTDWDLITDPDAVAEGRRDGEDSLTTYPPEYMQVTRASHINLGSVSSAVWEATRKVERAKLARLAGMSGGRELRDFLGSLTADDVQRFRRQRAAEMRASDEEQAS